MDRITIKSEFGHSYLVIANSVEKENQYLLQMIIHNRLKGILHCKEYPEEEESYLYYEITNCKSLAREYENKCMTFEDIYRLFESINVILEHSNSYLLEWSFFILNPEYIYLDLETEELNLLYLPCREYIQNMEKEEIYHGRYYRLADFLLEKVNHKEEHAVNIAYQFYKMSKEEFFSISSFINYAEKERIMKEKEKKEIKEVSPAIFEEKEELPCEIPKSSSHKAWLAPVVTGIISLILFFVYLYCKGSTIFDIYIILLSLAFLIFTVVRILWNVIKVIQEKREDSFDIPQESVRVEDYWNDEQETVYFEESNSDLQEFPVLEWKENNLTKKYAMESFPFTIGKLKEEAECYVNNPSVSRLHARLFKKDNSIMIQDLDSTNGTCVNGVPLLAGEELAVKRGDELQLGKLVLFVV